MLDDTVLSFQFSHGFSFVLNLVLIQFNSLQLNFSLYSDSNASTEEVLILMLILCPGFIVSGNKHYNLQSTNKFLFCQSLLIQKINTNSNKNRNKERKIQKEVEVIIIIMIMKFIKRPELERPEPDYLCLCAILQTDNQQIADNNSALTMNSSDVVG